MFEVILFSLVVLCALIILLCKYVVPGLALRQPEPWYLDYARSFFPVLLIVFALRGFVAEPFRIPSGSMLPTLEVGDFILVNKFKYGIRLPILHDKVIEIDTPKRGDIMVFRYPGDNKTNYIKRVIGLPGDSIDYRNKRLRINGELIENVEDGLYTPFAKNGEDRAYKRYTQTVSVANAAENKADVENDTDTENKTRTQFSILLDQQRYSSRNRVTTVPPGHYFVLGDNRDHSQDSRYWGFVPDKNIVGKAFFIWFHWNNNTGGGVKLSRVGADI